MRVPPALVRTLAISAVLACVALALAQGALAQERSVDLSGRIAYVTPRGQLAILDPTVGEPRLLSDVGPTFQFPAFSPDGDRIAAIGIDASEGSVHIFDGTSEVAAYRSEAEPPIYLYWAPDGETLSFLTARAETGLGLWLAVEGAEPRLTATGNPFYWAWNPDASSLLAHVGLTGEGSRLAFARPHSGLAAENLDPPGWFQAPGISPSGRYVAYGTAGPAGSRRVVVASHPHVAGEIVRREFAHDGFAMLGWHPTRDLLAVVAPTQPSPHWFGPIQILDAEDGLLDVVVDDIVLAFFWSPDGRKLAYVTPVPNEGVQQVAGVSQPTLVQQAPVRLRIRVAYLDGTDVDRVTTLATIAPSPLWVNQFLPFFDQYALSHRIWSPGSDALVVPVLGSDGAPRVVVFGLDGMRREVAVGDMPFWNVR